MNRIIGAWYVHKKRGGKQHGLPPLRGYEFLISMSLLHHSGLSGWHGRLLLRLVADEAFGGQEHTSHRSGILQSHALYLGGVDDTSLAQVFVLVLTGIVAEVALALANLVHHDSALATGVEDDLAQRLLDGATYDVDTRLLIGVVALEVLELFLSTDDLPRWLHV